MRPYLHLAWLEKREVKNHIIDRPHQAANSGQNARAAFPSMIQSHTARKLANNSSITNKEHVDQCPIPDNDQVDRGPAKRSTILSAIDRTFDPTNCSVELGLNVPRRSVAYQACMVCRHLKCHNYPVRVPFLRDIRNLSFVKFRNVE